jgi:colanic acid biosynthesis glycosyl transferase WcaI
MPQKSQAADLVLPSKLSGMLASGRPIIAMADPGTGIALETEGAGLIIPPGDAAALVAAMTALADDAALRARFGSAARQRAQQRWDRDSIIRSLEHEFSKIERPASRRRSTPYPLDQSNRLWIGGERTGSPL